MKKFNEWLKENNQNNIELWLDDERDPTDPFIVREFGSNSNMIWVKTVPEAKKLIETGKVVFISFDNDLAQPEEGQHLAKWIEEQAFNNTIPPLKWKIHSMNVAGRKEIQAAMTNADKFWRA